MNDGYALSHFLTDPLLITSDCFDKGLAIVEYRDIQGEIARISHHKAVVLRKLDPQTEEVEREAQRLEDYARELKTKVAKEQDQDEIPGDSDEAYDVLICGYFR